MISAEGRDVPVRQPGGPGQGVGRRPGQGASSSAQELGQGRANPLRLVGLVADGGESVSADGTLPGADPLREPMGCRAKLELRLESGGTGPRHYLH